MLFLPWVVVTHQQECADVATPHAHAAGDRKSGGLIGLGASSGSSDPRAVGWRASREV